MIDIGCLVRVLYPFDAAFPDIYKVVDKQDTTCFLENQESAFDERYLEVI